MIAVFVPDKTYKRKIKPALNSASNKTIIDIDSHIMAGPKLHEMLRYGYENLGKQIARKDLPVYNASILYRLIISSVEDGFNHLS